MLNSRMIKQWSQIGMRGTFGQIMYEDAKADPDVMVISSDLGTTSGLAKYMELLPDQFLNVGIAEQNMIGVASGMCLEGYSVFATSFAPFATARCLEQIKVNLGEMQIPVRIVGIASGFEMEYFGNSHYGYDDMASLRSISGITILSPADTTELVKMLECLKTYDKPVYLRLTRTTRKGLVYKEDFGYEIGRANTLRPLAPITIMATGSIVSTALKVADRVFESLGVSCGVVDMHTIKPMDERAIFEAASRSQLLVTLEEHNLIGGLGSAVAECICEMDRNVPMLKIGVPDIHIHNGDYDFLMNAYNLNEEAVLKTICGRWKKLSY